MFQPEWFVASGRFMTTCWLTFLEPIQLRNLRRHSNRPSHLHWDGGEAVKDTRRSPMVRSRLVRLRCSSLRAYFREPEEACAAFDGNPHRDLTVLVARWELASFPRSTGLP